VKISHHSLSSGPCDFGLIYLIISGLLVIISPFLLVFYADGLYGQTERKMLDLDVAHSKQAVLVLHQVDGVKIFNSASAEIGDISDMADCTMKILQKPTDKYRIQTNFQCEIENVIGFDAYSYFLTKMNGFSTVSGGYVTQLISSHSSTFSASSQAALFSRVEFTQLYASDSSHLLPATGASISDSFSPASIGRLWDPENAQKNHTSRNIRFSETYSNTRWNQGIADNFNLQIDFEFPIVMAERKVKMWTGIKYGLIQYLAFFIVFFWVFGKVNDFLFESGVFLSFTKVDSIRKAKRG